MAGDRGLALVIIGMMGSALWIAAARRIPAHQPQSSDVASAVNDAMFLARAAQQSLAQTLLCELAEERGSLSIRRLAAHISSQYRGVNAELRRLASLQGVKISGEIDAESRAVYNKLAALAGEAFDRTYESHVLRSDQLAAADLQQEATTGTHPELTRFASENLPATRQRLLLIEDTAAQAGISELTP